MTRKVLLIACFVLATSINAQSVSQDYSVLKNASLTNNHETNGKKTLLEAIRIADMMSMFESEGPFTVFEPTDAALTNLPDEYRLNELLKPENKQKLKNLVGYHVVKGNFKVEDLSELIKENDGEATLETLNGSKLILSLSYGNIKIKDQHGNISTIKNHDINSSNGIVHVVDKVLIP